MKLSSLFCFTLAMSCLTVLSCENEAVSDSEKKPLNVQDISVDPALEEALAKENETIADAQKRRDEINARIRVSEENANQLNDILGGE